jgi:hypothetical protein
MSQLQSVVCRSWTAFDLPGVRENDRFATYSMSPKLRLPPITIELDDSFNWLRERQADEVEECPISGGDEALVAQYRRVREQVDVAMPPVFDTFMQSPDLHQRVRSVTCCYLQMPDFLVRTAGVEDGYLIHFLSDQQWCCHWNLYLDQNGEQLVLGSDEAFGFEGEKGVSRVDLREENVWICADSFNEFLYRFWIENEISFKYGEEALTSEQQEYVDFYRHWQADRVLRLG